jgi:hypothetical protein
LRQRRCLRLPLLFFAAFDADAFRFPIDATPHTSHMPLLMRHFLRYFIALITPLFRHAMPISPCHISLCLRHYYATPLLIRFLSLPPYAATLSIFSFLFIAAAISPIRLSRYFDAPLADFMMPWRHTLADSFGYIGFQLHFRFSIISPPFHCNS